MINAILYVAILILLVGVIGSVVFYQSRKTHRRHKNYERGLKMITLFIHLPPTSDDIEANGRDTRDVIEETVSKAQTIYNIIASTEQSGFKSVYYGQRHFSFEIIGSQGFVYFYASVPISLVEVVKQAIVSAYPSARLDEVSDHNIFNRVGKLNATTGGEMVLKQSFAYPIATYQESKRDGLQSVLNALSTLNKEDGAAIQILVRPAHKKWREHAKSVADAKRSGKKQSKGSTAGYWLKSFATALAKPPEEKKDGEKKKELSNLEQATLDSIDEKTRQAGYEVLLRVVASSNISQRAQAILSNIVASFSIYDSPGKNGFKFVPAKNIDELVTDYILRIFPQDKNHTILNSTEMATIFHFPDQRNVPTSQLTRQASKQVDGPRDMPEDGLLLGYNLFRGAKKPIRLSLVDRQRHMYVVGQTGTGKSTFLEDLAFQDMKRGNGFAFVDPHGDTAEKLLAMVPKERVEDVIYFCPGDMDYPMGLNLFEFQSPDQKDFLIQEALNMLYKLYDPNHQGIMGPRYENLFRNAALTIMADPEGGTFVDIPKLFRDPQYVKQKLQHVTDPTVIEFWQKEVPQSQRSNDFGEVVSWFVSKFGAFLSNEMMRNIIGQTKSAFDLRQIMDERKILLVNLSKGRTGELNSRLLGMVFVMKFQAAAMSRANVPESERVDFCLYVDEFQNFSTDSFATIMSEARKYRLNLIVANQFTTQLTDEVRDAVFGNMGTIIAFRIGQNDVESLARYFQPTFDAEDLLRVPNFNTIVRTLVNGVPTQPFSMATLPSLGTPNAKLAEALKQLSAAKYGRPRGLVEKDIFARMETKTNLASSTFGPGASSPWSNSGAPSPFAMPGSGSGPGPARNQPIPTASVPPSMPGSGSFLDEWLSKRQKTSLNGDGLQPQTVPPVSAPAYTPSVAQQPQTPLAHVSSSPAASYNPLAVSQTEAGQQSAASVSPTATSDQSENISSEVLEEQEATKIAKELEGGLNLGSFSKDSQQMSKQNPVPNIATSTQIQSVDGSISLADTKSPTGNGAQVQSTLPRQQAAKGDTIYIDREGNLHMVEGA